MLACQVETNARRDSSNSFPLTPALSLGEREKHSPLWFRIGSLRTIAMRRWPRELGKCKSRRPWFPLHEPYAQLVGNERNGRKGFMATIHVQSLGVFPSHESGVRPSPGAATFEAGEALGHFSASGLSDLPAPEAGRTPVQRCQRFPGKAMSRATCRRQSPMTVAALLALGCCVQAAEEALFVAQPLTAENSFTAGIEGPACDARGNIYAVNFARERTIGKVTPDGKAELFVELPGKSTGNGIVFGRDGTMYV